MKKIFVIIFLLLTLGNKALAETPHYLDFKLILNQSDAGKKAQKFLKSKLEIGLKNIRDKQPTTTSTINKLVKVKKDFI